MVTDPIADLLTRIRNAVKAKHSKTVVAYSKLKVAILEVLKQNKYVDDFKIIKVGNFDQIEISMNNAHTELHLKRVSKPGQRIYIKKGDLKPVLNGYGIGVISTSRGIMTTLEARKNGLGGELLCEIW
ncbi:30S ribosomal protein S8 [Patescibacteria group bacterium]|nr:30S ribosomal protein S8 [Patescibacteria group bacterium]MBU1016440.1 30S ribosomal protein S8 [Patescibacteria group bacterium]MBU1684938.1 30S ribosomal protein S8 [Patescibacteria group bacterium]MBU1939034.1 30S ribosomal protein S8 [Patescibacteria group bacterium]